MSNLDIVTIVGMQQRFATLAVATPELGQLLNAAPHEIFAMSLLVMAQEYAVDETTGDLAPRYTVQDAAARAGEMLYRLADALDAFEEGGEDVAIEPLDNA